MNFPNEFWHAPVDEEVDYMNVPPPASAAAIRRWEEVHEVRLPPTLVEALMIQDGGYVHWTNLFFEGLDTIATLDGEDWDHVEEGLGLSPGDRRKQFLIGDCAGLGVVLDYNVGPEPRILFLWHDLGGELRGIDGLETFDQFLQATSSCKTPGIGETRQTTNKARSDRPRQGVPCRVGETKKRGQEPIRNFSPAGPFPPPLPRGRDPCETGDGRVVHRVERPSGVGDAMSESWRSLITLEPGKRGGRRCIRGMRITVSDVLSYLAAGMSEAEVLDDFPYLTVEDVRACLAFAAERERQMLVASA